MLSALNVLGNADNHKHERNIGPVASMWTRRWHQPNAAAAQSQTRLLFPLRSEAAGGIVLPVKVSFIRRVLRSLS